ncbi:related to ERV41-component of copii vesicles involved in transport between the ER and golgi complex [Rhynchosporium agropyri]|uniref:Endoplasmic reticulum-Golgi intermediate compartment protein n=1 Tax=Rhynchosporium agropyri TaxID=914238 RepID=A0A1E1KDL4_9HELO|nr:related to ERV41-component of copii vesicles involved in transport between the ER and golgi complex [Rhynchosporium agropyri]
MNGFSSQGLDEDAFGEKRGNIVQAFDAFPKAKPQYVTRTSGGGKWTVAMLLVSALLIFSEFSRWWRGIETHTFAVENSIGHNLQINLDIVIPMHCEDIHVNVQDAAGDRILAATMLKEDTTLWGQWVDARGVHRLGKDANGKVVTGEEYHEHDEGFGEEHVHDIVAATGWGRAKFAKTPRLPWGVAKGDSCRIYGSLDVNKVQGDFHITARGHGYQEFAAGHLDHTGMISLHFVLYSQDVVLMCVGTAFNFSHIVSELSFGEFYPSLVNPLDRTIETTENHFHKFQYFLSVVPTDYSIDTRLTSRYVFTNQYAVTEQSHAVGEYSVPGIFFKYDIEPILLMIDERRESFLRFLVKIVNVVSGVLVAGHWGFTLTEWARSIWGKRSRGRSDGVIHGRSHEMDD